MLELRTSSRSSILSQLNKKSYKISRKPLTRSSSVRSVSSADSNASSHGEPGRSMRCIEVCGAILSSVGESPAAKTCLAPIRFLSSSIAERLAKSRFHGWRAGVLIGILSSSIILCINLTFLIVTAKIKDGYKTGFAEPFRYDRTTMSRLSVAIHIAINAFGTILFTASNYTLQVLASPTRYDLDKSHRTGQYFDIGVLSVRNLKMIPRRRLMLCMALGLSSLPLHLL